MKTLMLMIDRLRTMRSSEEALVKAAIYENLRPRLSESDLLIFERTVADIFPEAIPRRPSLRDPMDEKYRAIADAPQLGTLVLGDPSCKTTLI